MDVMSFLSIKRRSKGDISLITGVILVLLVIGIGLFVANMIGLRIMDTFVGQIAEKIDYYLGGFKN